MQAERGKSGQPSPLAHDLIPEEGVDQALCPVPGELAGEGAAVSEEVFTSQSELRRLSTLMLTIQESERLRIAKDLHDGLGQSLTLIRLGLEGCAALLATSELSEAEELLQQLRSRVQDAFGELRRVTMDLRPSMLDDLGILATLSWFFREFESVSHSIIIEKNLLVQEKNIPIPLKISIFRILQEAFSNIVKHAKADRIRVSLMKAEGALHLSIEDNGQGFDPADQGKYSSLDKGLGLLSMKERAIFSGGTFRLDSFVGQGTRVYVSWSSE